MNNWLQRAWWRWRFQTDPRTYELRWRWWPYRFRPMLRYTACAVLGHIGGGTFGYYRCNRCLGDWG